MTDKETVDSVVTHIKSLISTNFLSFKNEIGKFLETIEEEIEKLHSVAIAYKSKIEKLKIEWKTVEEEVNKLKNRKEVYDEREDQVDKKVADIEKQEEDLLSLHQVLLRKKKILEAKERKLDKDIRSSKEKIATPL